MSEVGFWQELRRRHVVRVAVAYAVVGWLLIQIATQVFPFFTIPNWAVRLLVLLVLAGFPIALVLAWAFEATPTGVRRTDADGQPVQRRARRGTLIVAVIGVLLAVAVGAGYWHRPGPGRATSPSSTSGVLDPATKQAPATVANADVPARSIAVLPFENLSTDKNNAYFADGMQGLILTRLVDIGELHVASRTSTNRFASHPGDLRKIARELGVASILEGSVQKAGDQVLINLQLIDAKTDRQLWAQSYQRTLDNIFGVEGEVAQKVANALKAELTHAESVAIANIPTRNKQAYQAYLKGVYYLNNSNRSGNDSDLLRSIALCKQATEADPDFANAWVLLALGYQKLGGHVDQAAAAAQRALALEPQNAAALIEYAFVLTRRRQFDAAIAQAQEAVRLQPKRYDVRAGLGFVYWAAGQLDKAAAAFGYAADLAPEFGFAQKQLATLAMMRRDYATALDELQSVTAHDPADVIAATMTAEAHVLGWGDLHAARQALQDVPTSMTASGLLAQAWFRLSMCEHDYAGALRAASAVPAQWLAQQGGSRSLYKALAWRAQGDARRRLPPSPACATSWVRVSRPEMQTPTHTPISLWPWLGLMTPARWTTCGRPYTSRIPFPWTIITDATWPLSRHGRVTMVPRSGNWSSCFRCRQATWFPFHAFGSIRPGMHSGMSRASGPCWKDIPMPHLPRRPRYP